MVSGKPSAPLSAWPNLGQHPDGPALISRIPAVLAVHRPSDMVATLPVGIKGLACIRRIARNRDFGAADPFVARRPNRLRKSNESGAKSVYRFNVQVFGLPVQRKGGAMGGRTRFPEHCRTASYIILMVKVENDRADLPAKDCRGASCIREIERPSGRNGGQRCKAGAGAHTCPPACCRGVSLSFRAYLRRARDAGSRSGSRRTLP